MSAKKKLKKAPEAKETEGTKRWPTECVARGEFIQLPNVLLKRFGRFGIKPHHLWLLLALQVDRFGARAPRYYWGELADWAGVSVSTVRRWAYELRDMKLLRIRTNRKLNPGDTPRVGYRNERNEFYLDPFEKKARAEQLAWEKERPARRSKKAEDGS